MTTTLEETLAHFGVKGMRWGVRGGKGTPAAKAPQSEDSRRSVEVQNKVKVGGTRTLSNQELQVLVTRMNLERQFKSLQPPTNAQKATKFVGDILVQIGKQQLTSLAAGVAAKQVANLVKKAA